MPSLTGHAPHPVTDLPSLDGEPRCEIHRECPEHGVQPCHAHAEWVLTQPCAGCGDPLSTLMCAGCKNTLLKRGEIPASSVRRL